MDISRSDSELEQFSLRLRNALGIAHILSPDVANLEGKLKEIFPGLTIEVLPDDEMEDDGEADCENKKIFFKRSVWKGILAGRPRDRMTFVHEVAHIALGHRGRRYRRDNDLGAKYSSIIRREEREARKFAALFLAPTELAMRFETAQDIEDHFQISAEAASIRLDEIDAMKRRIEGRKRPLPAGVISFLEWGKKKGYPVRTNIDSK